MLKYCRWWLNDIRTKPFFDAVRKVGNTVEVPYRTRNDWAHTRDDYYRYKDSDSDEARVLEPFLTHSGAGYNAGGPRSCGAGAGSEGYTNALRKAFGIMEATRVVVTDWDWTKVVARLGADDFVYLDPPYKNYDTRSYCDDIDHEHLVWVLKHAKFRWILSHYLHPIYLATLGQPFWAKEVQLCVSREGSRTECLWRNFSGSKHKEKSTTLPQTAVGKMRELDNAAALSFSALDAKIDDGLERVARDLSAMLPYLLEMHTRLAAPGKRSDLRKGAPAGLTWTAWVRSKRKKLGRSLRTIQCMLKGKTETSLTRQSLIQRRAELRQEPESPIPDAPMEIATEMARLVLEMQDQRGRSGSDWARLKLLAERFLRFAGQAPQPGDGNSHLDRIASMSSEPNWKM